MKKILTALVLSAVVLCAAWSWQGEKVESLTYAVFPYLPDAEYYQQVIESRWAELEPDIELVRADWDCYEDGVPAGIDVIMYDAVMQDGLVDAGWIRPIAEEDVQEPEDIFPFALEGVTEEGRLYGIPVFLCGNFLIYDRGCGQLAAAEHLTDLAGESGILVINSECSANRKQYAIEVLADTLGEANPPAGEDTEEALELIDRLAIDAHKRDSDPQVAAAFDAGEGEGYIGFSESMCLLEERLYRTGIKAVSFSDGENVPRCYVDMAAVTAGTKGRRYDKCVKLMNVMAEAEVLAELSRHDGDPQYLLIARKSPYAQLAEQFPLYAELEDLAADEKNQVIRTP